MSEQKASPPIQIHVSLDENRIPEQITWSAPGPEGESTSDAKAMLLSLFDRETKDTLKIDLWTKDMQIAEMDRFFYQTIRALADTYHKATSNTKLAESMQQFATYFGEEAEIIPKGS